MISQFPQFIMEFGGSGNEIPRDFMVLPDGYLVMGHTGSFSGSGLGKGDFFISKVDTLGNVLWTKAYGRVLGGGTNRYDYATWFDRTPDGYIMVGWTGTTSTSPYFPWHGFLIKLNSSFGVQWAKRIGRSTTFSGYKFRPWDVLYDGSGYVIVGQVADTNEYDYDGFWMKVSTDGNTILWYNRLYSYTYDPPGYFNGHSKAQLLFDVERDPEGYYVAVGRVEDSVHGWDPSLYDHPCNPDSLADDDDQRPEDWDVLVVRITPSGDTAWTRRYSGTNTGNYWPLECGSRESAIAVEVLPSGHYVVVGYTNAYEQDSLDPDMVDLLVMKINKNDGSIIWSKVLTGSGVSGIYDKLFYVKYYNGHLYLAAHMYAGATTGRAFFIKMDTLGNVIWIRRFNKASVDDAGRSVKVNSYTGNVVFMGKTAGDVFLAQLSSSGTYEGSTLCGELTNANYTFSSRPMYSYSTQDSLRSDQPTLYSATVSSLDVTMTKSDICPLHFETELDVVEKPSEDEVEGETKAARIGEIVSFGRRSITLRLYYSGRYTFTLYDLSGRRVGRVSGDFKEGLHRIPLKVKRGIVVLVGEYEGRRFLAKKLMVR